MYTATESDKELTDIINSLHLEHYIVCYAPQVLEEYVNSHFCNWNKIFVIKVL